MHTIICRHGVYFSGTVRELRVFLQKMTRYDIHLTSWIKDRLH